MNEREWLKSTDPQPMLRLLGESADDRKLRLFTCACLRQLCLWTDDPALRRAVQTAERFADDLATPDEVWSAFVVAWPNGWEGVRSAAAAAATGPAQGQCWRVASLAYAVADRVVRCGYGQAKSARGSANWGSRWAEVQQGQADLLREVFGNPFRPATADPAWLTPEVRRVARAIYDDREFEDLPFLGDALEEAGCDDERVMRHCRGGGAHVRGCWMLDLLLGRPAGTAVGPHEAVPGPCR